VELFPYAQRSRGIAIEQFSARFAGFFTTFVNPIGMDYFGWKYLLMYIFTISLEIATIWFFYPETQGRTLEELAFCKLCLVSVTLCILRVRIRDIELRRGGANVLL
jgi:hypothetical protein